MHVPQTQEITAGGTTVEYVSYGDPNSESKIVLEHGISVGPELWGELPKLLATLGHYVVAVGRPEGKNAPAWPTLVGYAVEQQPAIHALVGRQYNLVGLSFGGLLAQAHAIIDPHALEHLVIAGAPLFAPTLPGIPDPRALAAISSSHRSPDMIAQIYGGDFHDLALQEEFRPIIEREIDDLDHRRQMFAAMFSGHLAVWKTWQQVWGPLWGVRTPPTLAMAGTDDPISPFSAAERAAHAIGASFVPIENGGHGFMLTRAAWCAGVIDAFIRDQPLDVYMSQEAPLAPPLGA